VTCPTANAVRVSSYLSYRGCQHVSCDFAAYRPANQHGLTSMVVLCQSRQICLFTLDCITTDRNQRSAERLSFNIIIVVVTDLHIKYSRCRTTCSCNGKYCCHRSIQKSYLPKWGNVYREQTGYLTAQRVSLANHVMAHPSLAKRSEIVRNCTEMAKFLSAYILHIFVYYMYPINQSINTDLYSAIRRRRITRLVSVPTNVLFCKKIF